MNEKALCIPADLAFGLGVQNGLMPSRALATLIIGSTERMRFLPRDEVENDPAWLQLIPYCLLIDDASRVFGYRRSKSGGESRLHGDISVGIGGHIKPVDASGDGSEYTAGLMRELTEEVDVEPQMHIGDPIALIYDDSNQVGRVHLGVVHIVDIGDSLVTACEDSIAEPQMHSVCDLLGVRDELESWSQMCVDYLAKTEAA